MERLDRVYVFLFQSNFTILYLSGEFMFLKPMLFFCVSVVILSCGDSKKKQNLKANTNSNKTHAFQGKQSIQLTVGKARLKDGNGLILYRNESGKICRYSNWQHAIVKDKTDFEKLPVMDLKINFEATPICPGAPVTPQPKAPTVGKKAPSHVVGKVRLLNVDGLIIHRSDNGKICRYSNWQRAGIQNRSEYLMLDYLDITINFNSTPICSKVSKVEDLCQELVWKYPGVNKNPERFMLDYHGLETNFKAPPGCPTRPI